MMERRKTYIMSVQDTKQKGNEAGSTGGGIKVFFHGEDTNLSGDGVIIKHSA